MLNISRLMRFRCAAVLRSLLRSQINVLAQNMINCVDAERMTFILISGSLNIVHLCQLTFVLKLKQNLSKLKPGVS